MGSLNKYLTAKGTEGPVYNNMPKLEINEVFTSINGEVSPCLQGSIATFIRFSGCNLECPWCDTKQHNKANISEWVTDIYPALEKANKGKLAKNITITGGEPLRAYKANVKGFLEFLSILHNKGHVISIETNGTFRLPSDIRPYIKGFVVDYKFFLLETVGVEKAFAAGTDLRPCDYVKLVVDKSAHIGLAKQFLSYYTSFVASDNLPTFAVSIVNEGGNHFLVPEAVIKSFADDGYDVLLNVQIHKFLKVP